MSLTKSVGDVKNIKTLFINNLKRSKYEEPCDGRLSSTVPREGRGETPLRLLDYRHMPEIFRFFGFSFFFYSREHEPIHVHIEGNGGYAVYDLDGDSFVLREKQNIKANDQKKIESVIEENKDIIIKRWKEHFEK